MILRLVAALLALLALPAPAMAWWAYGHETTARIALANVQPRTHAAIVRLLAFEEQLGTPECPTRTLALASTWPDCIRREGWRWGYTAAWHYQTEPIDQLYDARKNCGGGACVSAQIVRNHRILADERLPGNVRLEALSFMMHFAVYIHMPLHSGDNGDQGGNGLAASYGIVPSLNLHAIWDGYLVERAISSANPPLVRHYAASERAALAGGEPADWGRESWALSRDFVYPNALGRPLAEGERSPEAATLTQEAIAAAVPVAERRIVQAGLRIAALLNSAMAPGPLPPAAVVGR